MAALKQKGDRAEIEVARDLIRRGFRIAIPYGEDWDFDLIFQRPGYDALERVQVKFASRRGAVIPVRTCSASLTGGRVKRFKRYTAQTIDWMAVFEPAGGRCYYVPASELGNGRDELSLRLGPTRNNQAAGIRWAADYVDPLPAPKSAMDPAAPVEPAGIEPAPSCLQSTRSPN
jgi:hypothetical protein